MQCLWQGRSELPADAANPVFELLDEMETKQIRKDNGTFRHAFQGAYTAPVALLEDRGEALFQVSRISCHFAQIRSYRTSVKLPQLRLSAVITIEEFPKSGSELLLKTSSRH